MAKSNGKYRSPNGEPHYTFTEDERFFAIADARALVVSACSGHGHKFGAAVGRRVADAVEIGEDDSRCGAG